MGRTRFQCPGLRMGPVHILPLLHYNPHSLQSQHKKTRKMKDICISVKGWWVVTLWVCWKPELTHPKLSVTLHWSVQEFLRKDQNDVQCDSITLWSVGECKPDGKVTFTADELTSQSRKLLQCVVTGLCVNSSPWFSRLYPTTSSFLTLRQGAGPASQELVLVPWPQWHLLHVSVWHACTCSCIKKKKMIGLHFRMVPGTIWLIWVLSLAQPCATRQRQNLSEPQRHWPVGRSPSSPHPYLIISSCRDPGWLTCCLRDVAEPCFASEAALSGLPLSSSTAAGSSVLLSVDPRTSKALSTISMCLHLSTSSSSTPASVALRRSPMRTRSVPDQSEFTQPRRAAILVAEPAEGTGTHRWPPLQLPRNGYKEWTG